MFFHLGTFTTWESLGKMLKTSLVGGVNHVLFKTLFGMMIQIH